MFPKNLKDTEFFKKFVEYCCINSKAGDLLELEFKNREEKEMIASIIKEKLKGRESEF